MQPHVVVVPSGTALRDNSGIPQTVAESGMHAGGDRASRRAGPIMPELRCGTRFALKRPRFAAFGLSPYHAAYRK